MLAHVQRHQSNAPPLSALPCPPPQVLSLLALLVPPPVLSLLALLVPPQVLSLLALLVQYKSTNADLDSIMLPPLHRFAALRVYGMPSLLALLV